MGRKVPNVIVPDVSGMSVVDAEQSLIDAGFVVNEKVESIADEKYNEGTVVRTDPEAGRSIKKGKTITIFKSTGKETYAIEDYKGKNYIEIQTLLKNVHKLDVKVEKKEYESDEEIDSQLIIDQSVKPGEEVKAGDKIILYIPDIYDKYPDFVNEEWSLSDIEVFCEKYKVNLSIVYEQTNDYKEGQIIRQSRKANDRIVSGATLKITVAKEMPEQDDNINNNDNKDNNSVDDSNTP